MNENNLQELGEEMKKLGFGPELVSRMEAHIAGDIKEFALHDQVLAAKGHVGIDLHFRQSPTSDLYYLNRLEATRHWGRGLEPGQEYLLVGTARDGAPEVLARGNSLSGAIETFGEMKGNVELAMGRELEDRMMMARRENGELKYLSEEFKRDFQTPPLPQSFWLERGRGFSREQAANLVSGRAVYREDLLSREGKPYKAWVQLDMEAERQGKAHNLPFNHYTDAYGYELKSVLAEYKLKELSDPLKLEALEASLKNGNRVMVGVEKEGKDAKVFVETSVRYGKLNFFSPTGAPEKREQFQKVPDVSKVLSGTSREKGQQQQKETAGPGLGR